MSEIEANKRVSFLNIEWDGDRPPTKWYSRLHSLGIFVRGEKELSPFDRRSSKQGNGFVAQEGSLYLDSDDQARTLGHLARELGARSVVIGSLETHELNMSNADVQALNRIKQTMGKRGRPMPEQAYVVSCLAEGKSYEYTGKARPNCPHCGSFNVNIRAGNQVRCSLDTTKTIGQNWIMSRFSNGFWEEPIIDMEFNLPELNPDVIGHEHMAIVNKVLSSTLATQIVAAHKAGKISVEQAVRMLDAGFQVLQQEKDKRLHDRIYAITKWIEQGGQPGELMVKMDDVDAFDIYQIDKSVFYTLL